jgi:hypothetical protein
MTGPTDVWEMAHILPAPGIWAKWWTRPDGRGNTTGDTLPAQE